MDDVTVGRGAGNLEGARRVAASQEHVGGSVAATVRARSKHRTRRSGWLRAVRWSIAAAFVAGLNGVGTRPPDYRATVEVPGSPPSVDAEPTLEWNLGLRAHRP